jgi:hypothetical protein
LERRGRILLVSIIVYLDAVYNDVLVGSTYRNARHMKQPVEFMISSTLPRFKKEIQSVLEKNKGISNISISVPSKKKEPKDPDYPDAERRSYYNNNEVTVEFYVSLGMYESKQLKETTIYSDLSYVSYDESAFILRMETTGGKYWIEAFEYKKFNSYDVKENGGSGSVSTMNDLIAHIVNRVWAVGRLIKLVLKNILGVF